MKYFIIVFDGMADRPIPELGGHTPMELAVTPCLDELCKKSLCGNVLNVPTGMVPESDTANLAILSYDPRVYSKGRSPLEAMSMGIEMLPEDTAIRCNVVTLSDEGEYEDKIMIDHSADEISTPEAAALIASLEEALGDETKKFYPGVSYRHCLIWKNIPDNYKFMRPHDILGRPIREYLPSGEGEIYLDLMKKSWNVLADHPINVERRKRGLRPANSIWLWSPGKKPALPSFEEKWGLRASVISAVDLIKGIAKCAKMESIDVVGATGNISTNFEGKAYAARDAFERGADLVFVHVEAPDECGHRGEAENKVKSIGYIDTRILAPVYEYLKASGEDFKILALPDHPTPIETRTHSPEPVPFLIYSSNKEEHGVEKFTEANAAATGIDIPDGTALMGMLTETK